MEFIEAKIDPNSTLKMLSKRPRRGPQNMKQKRNKKTQKCETVRTPPRHQLARPSRATLLAGLCWVASWVHGPCLARFARVVRRFALLGARGFLDPLILNLLLKSSFSSRHDDFS